MKNLRSGLQPLVSIHIAAYNRLEQLKESVASALKQSWDNIEVLVIDDGSGNLTRNWLEQEAQRNERLCVIHQPNSGVAAARQAGLKGTKAEFVCVLDSDDLLDEYAVERLVAEFRADPALDLVYANNVHFRNDGRSYPSRYPRFDSNEAMLRACFLRPIFPFKHSGTMFRRDVALELGGYNAGLSIKVDIDFLFRFLTTGRNLRLLEEPLVRFRIHSESMSHSRRFAGMRVWVQLVDRYRADRSIILRIGYKCARIALEGAKALYALFKLR